MFWLYVVESAIRCVLAYMYNVYISILLFDIHPFIGYVLNACCSVQYEYRVL